MLKPMKSRCPLPLDHTWQGPKALVFFSVIVLTNSGLFICLFIKFQRVRKSWAASCCTNTEQTENTTSISIMNSTQQTSHRWQREIHFPPSDPVSSSLDTPCQGQSLGWRQAAVSPYDPRRQWEKMGGLKCPIVEPSAKSCHCRWMQCCPFLAFIW